MESLSIAVADDQPIIRDAFAAILDSQPDLNVVVRASNGKELVEAVRDQSIDVTLVDVRMPEMDGITATGLISDRTKVLILTTFDLDDYVHDSLRAGASGFLLKDVPAERLIEAVRLVASGSLLLGPSVTRRVVEELGSQKRSTPPPNLPLTPRELDVLRLVATGKSNAEIAATLVLSPETIKSHVAEILRKLHVRDRVQAVVYAFENGIMDNR